MSGKRRARYGIAANGAVRSTSGVDG
jgi:hypothetical protein